MTFPELPLLDGPAAALFAPERHQLLECCGSTNDVARQLAENGAPEGTLVLADAQESGRGRLGRSWFSPPGRSIYLSLLLRPTLDPGELPLLTLALAVAAADVLQDAGTDVAVKWPNDLVVRHPGSLRKLAGIACEAIHGRHVAVAAGIGINVNLTREELPPDLDPLATSVRIETGRSADRAALAARLLERFAPLYQLLLRRGSAGILPLYRARLETVGRDVTVDVGQRIVRGRAVGIGPIGELEVACADGHTEIITAGDVGME